MIKLFINILIPFIMLFLAPSAFAIEAWTGVYAGEALKKQIEPYTSAILSVNHVSRESWAKDIETLSKKEYSEENQNPLKLFVLALSIPYDDPTKLNYLTLLVTEYPNSRLAKDAALQISYYWEYQYLRSKKEADYNKAMLYLAKIDSDYPDSENTLNIHHPDHSDTNMLSFNAMSYISAAEILSRYAKAKQDRAVGQHAISIYTTLSRNGKLNFKPDNYGTPLGMIGMVDAIKIAMMLDNPTSLIEELKINYPDIYVRAGTTRLKTHAWATVQLADYTYKTGDIKTAHAMYTKISKDMSKVTETNLVTNAEINYGDYALQQINNIANANTDDAVANIDMSNDTPNEVDIMPADAAFARGDYAKAMPIYKQLIIKYQKLDDYEAKEGQWRETLIARARNGYITCAENLGKTKPQIFNMILGFAPAQDYMVRYLAIEYLLQEGDKDQVYALSKDFIERYKDKPKEYGSVYLSMPSPLAKVQKIYDKLSFEREAK